MKDIIKQIFARQVLDSRGNPTVEAEVETEKGIFRAMVPSGASTGRYEAVELRDGDELRLTHRLPARSCLAVAGGLSPPRSHPPAGGGHLGGGRVSLEYQGQGVRKAVDNVNNVIEPKLVGMDPINQKEIDQLMIDLDGTDNKSKLGANAILAVSMAMARAGAASQGLDLYKYLGKLSRSNMTFAKGHSELGSESHETLKQAQGDDLITSQFQKIPVPMSNIINGGRHAGEDYSFQEYMIVPIGAKNFNQSLQMIVETYHQLKNLLKEKLGVQGTLVGDEGGFAPMSSTFRTTSEESPSEPLRSRYNSVEERLELILEAIEKAGYKDKIKLALDPAASEFYHDGVYQVGEKKYQPQELINYYSELIKKYPIISIEDPLAEDDWDSWTQMTDKLGDKMQIVGDDLLVTNPERIKKAISEKAVNAVLIKPNQIGTITETLEAIKLAKNAGWKTVVSHRSGETEDIFIADLAVGVSADFCKFGAPCRSDRNSKYNQLLRVEEKLLHQ